MYAWKCVVHTIFDVFCFMSGASVNRTHVSDLNSMAIFLFYNYFTLIVYMVYNYNAWFLCVFCKWTWRSSSNF